MVVSAVVVGVASVAGAVVSSQASSKAAKAQTTAAENQIQLAQNEFNTQQANEAPYLQAGNNALQTLVTGSAPGGQFNQTFTAADFQNTPGYQASLAAGQSAIQAQAARGGQSLSPATMGALAQYTANASLQDYNTAYSQFMQKEQMALGEQESIAQMGQAAVAGTNSALQNSTGQQIAAQGAIGNAKSANDIAQGNAINQGINGVAGAVSGGMGNYYQQQYMNNLFTPTNTGVSATGPNSALNDPNYFSASEASQLPMQTPVNF